MTHCGCFGESSNICMAKAVMNSICFICGRANSVDIDHFSKRLALTKNMEESHPEAILCK